jgi:hypothetical protein
MQPHWLVCPRVGNQNAAIIPSTVMTATTIDFAISLPVAIATHRIKETITMKAIVTQNPSPNFDRSTYFTSIHIGSVSPGGWSVHII